MIKMADVLKAMCLDVDINACLQGIEYGEGGDFYILNLEYWDEDIEKLTDIYFDLFDNGTIMYKFKLDAEDIETGELYVNEFIVDLINKVSGMWTYLIDQEDQD